MDGSRILKFGLPGAADILGLVKPFGRLIAIECKTGSGKLSTEQASFRSMVEHYGGLYIEARGLEDVLLQLRLDPWSQEF